MDCLHHKTKPGQMEVFKLSQSGGFGSSG